MALAALKANSKEDHCSAAIAGTRRNALANAGLTCESSVQQSRNKEAELLLATISINTT